MAIRILLKPDISLVLSSHLLCFWPSFFVAGTLVFQLVAEDAENDPLYYSIEGENAYYFSVDSRTGNVTLKQPVDYEVKI